MTESFLPGLYLVATPIGNLKDITLRAHAILEAADYILCEDTRVTTKLLQAHSIRNQLVAYHDHNADKMRPRVLSDLKSGKCIALVSDAGMPLISDPGYKLVRDCQDEGLYVTTMPGASSVLSALQLSGLPSDRFLFMGFPSSKTQAFERDLRALVNQHMTFIFFERGSRVVDTLKTIQNIWGDREAAVVREITKKFEESVRAPIADLIQRYEKEAPRGEVVLVVDGGEPETVTEDDLKTQIQKALETMSVKDAAAYIAESSGQPKRKIYNLCLSLNKHD